MLQRAGRPSVAPPRARSVTWRDLVPAALVVDPRERVRVVLGALLGLLAVVLLSRSLVAPGDVSPWLVAPIGASAVLVFVAPAGPFSHPWAVVGGNTLSALAAIVCVRLLGDAPWVAAPAVAAAIAAMIALRCLHPPGGACALLVALGGVAEPGFALHPVLFNSALLVIAAGAWHRLTWRARPGAPQVEEGLRRSFTDGDLEAVLARRLTAAEAGIEELHELLEQARRQARRRRAQDIRCGDLVAGAPLAVNFGTPLLEAWTLLRRERIKALPVVDRLQRLVGIVTLADFLRAAGLEAKPDWPQRVHALLRPTPTTHSSKPETVGQIMVRQVRVVSADRPLADLLPLFASTGHHHVPVIDADKKLVGMITESDVVRALARDET